MKFCRLWGIRGRRRFAAVGLIVMLVLCGGCGLLQEEPEIREDLVKESQNQTKQLSYETAVVKQGDLNIYTALSCTAKCSEEQGLKFGKSGLNYGTVYVSVGDKVKKGQVLAELDMSGVEDVLSSAKREHLLKELEVADYGVQIADMRKIGNLSGMSSGELKDSIRQLETSRTASQSEARLAKAEYEEALQEKKNRQIIAPQNGIVTYIFNPETVKTNNGETVKSNRELEFMRISKGNYHFECITSDYENYPVGTEVTMTIESQKYKMKISAVEKAGKTGTEQEQKAVMKFEFLDEAYDLSANTLGFITSNEELKNVLYIPKDAVVSLQGETYVYLLDEDGMRTAQKVETGKSDGTNVEICSGLSVGQEVILK